MNRITTITIGTITTAHLLLAESEIETRCHCFARPGTIQTPRRLREFAEREGMQTCLLCENVQD